MYQKPIKEYVARLVDEFHPEQVVLFGSQAEGRATRDSDVDLMVVMNRSGHEAESALEIRRRIPRTFPLDLIVRTPSEVRRRLRDRDGFICSIFDKGKVLYEKKR